MERSVRVSADEKKNSVAVVLEFGNVTLLAVERLRFGRRCVMAAEKRAFVAEFE